MSLDAINAALGDDIELSVSLSDAAPEISAALPGEEPEAAATLAEARYLVFRGADYVLTDADKAEIAAMVPVPDETDPTVPAWAKSETKPSYTAAEVGALPDTTEIPTVPTAEISANTAARHTHGNNAALDGITAEKVTAWDSKLDTTGNAYRAASIPMGQVDGTSTATVFTATVPGITELRDGVCMWLKNGVVTSAAGFTININGLGAKPVYGSLAAATASTTIFNTSYTMLFIYNSTRVSGGCWDVVYGYDSNTNTIGYQLRTNSTTMPMDSITYRYRLLFTSADGKKWVPANNSTSTNATAARAVCQTKIDPHGRIVYYGTTASVAAGSRPGAAYLWDQYVVTLGYSFNRTGAALALTSWNPVYVKCTPQADGSAIIDADTPYVQSLPTTADGKIYIFLGIATAATTIELVPEHPVYCYRNGGIQFWTGVQSEIDSQAELLASKTYISSVIETDEDDNILAFELSDGFDSIEMLSSAATYSAIAETAGLPTVTAADNGKILRVVNGAWAAATVPSAESEAY